MTRSVARAADVCKLAILLACILEVACGVDFQLCPDARMASVEVKEKRGAVVVYRAEGRRDPVACKPTLDPCIVYVRVPFLRTLIMGGRQGLPGPRYVHALLVKTAKWLGINIEILAEPPEVCRHVASRGAVIAKITLDLNRAHETAIRANCCADTLKLIEEVGSIPLHEFRGAREGGASGTL